MKKPIVLVGAGGHAEATIDVIENEGTFNIVCLIGSNDEAGQCVLDYPVVDESDLNDMIRKHENFLVAVGQIRTAAVRKRLFEHCSENRGVPVTVISPRAYVSKHAVIGPGTIIMHDAIVNAGASVGKNCIVNNRVLIEHGALIGDHCHIATGAIINGDVSVGYGSFVGSGSVIKQGIRISAESLIHMGERVSKDVTN